ncbi:MAG: HD domain-containing phosphohydrolase [Acidobacteriota bacterium]
METAKGKTREEIINRLADRIDSFEKYTPPHSRLLAELAIHLARRFGLPPPDVDAIAEAAMLHDIGLYAMAPAYLSLPRPLSFEARLDLWRHSVIGEQQMAKRDAMRHAQLLVRWHHEWWNGSGYPDMLAFEDIPIGARILRAVELYGALLSDRPYRAALDEPQAIEALTSSAGIECDPYVVKALLALLDELRAGLPPPLPAHVAEAPTKEIQRSPFPEQPVAVEVPSAESSPSAVIAPEHSSGLSYPPPISEADNSTSEPARPLAPSSTSMQALASGALEPNEHPRSEPTRGGPATTEIVSPQPAGRETAHALPCESLLLRAQSIDLANRDSPSWRGWNGSRYNKKKLLGFEASVLRQIEFRSVAIPFWNEPRLDWYLKAWGKLIFANDPRAWAGTVARATVEGSEPLGEDTISRILEDVYVPGVRLANPDLRRWFGESDAWWMDNLRQNIDGLDDQIMRAQALALGFLTGDYALSFNEETRELRRPLTTVFWRLAGRAFAGPVGHPNNRSFNQPAEDFTKHARADLLYLSSPAAHSDRGGAEARSEWRESWATGSASIGMDQGKMLANPPQSKQSYLASIDRLLRLAAHFKTWAVEYQEPGLATAQDIIELIKEYRPVSATYSKDVTEVAGGQRSYIIVGEKKSAR